MFDRDSFFMIAFVFPAIATAMQAIIWGLLLFYAIRVLGIRGVTLHLDDEDDEQTGTS